MHYTDPLPRTADGVLLRRLAISDLPSFQAYRRDDELGRYQGWSATTDGDAASFLAEMSSADMFRPGMWFQFAIADAGTQALIGDIGLFLASDGRHAEIGFTLRRESQGDGLATAAVREAITLLFENTQAEQVLAVTDARNAPSIRLLERIGMRRTETREAIFKGEQCLEHVYVLSR